ncbi:MAG: (Fe-S)-binding protein [Deltaproteobacteria bacterium]|nr:(Fe-S)-binding protein [Deltaproteobacteria bacterium]
MILNDIANEFDQCIKCGLCLATCPVGKALFLEKYTPRGKVQLAKRYAAGDLEISKQYRDIFAKCLLCGSCTVTCPSGVDQKAVFLAMREEIVKKQGLHPNVKAAVDSLLVNHNISDEDNAERGDWRDDIRGLPEHMYEKEHADVVYFVGCVASFFPMVQSIPRNMVRILESAGVNFAILAGEEWCCGFPLIGAGAPEEMKALMDHNLEKVKALGAREVVFSCPSCYRTWKEHYPTDLKLSHSTQVMERLIKEGSISLGELKETVTYHDPCDLGRNAGVFDPPREILRAVPGLTFVELAGNRNQSVCCGGGGNLEMADAALSGRVAQNKIEEVRQTGARTVITACQQCVRTIKGKARREKLDLEVVDITDIVVRSMSHG